MQATRGQQQHIGDSTAAVLHHGDVGHATMREAQDEFRAIKVKTLESKPVARTSHRQKTLMGEKLIGKNIRLSLYTALARV